MKIEVIILRVDKQMKVQLKKVAKESNRTMSDYIRLIVQKAITEKTKV